MKSEEHIIIKNPLCAHVHVPHWKGGHAQGFWIWMETVHVGNEEDGYKG